MSSDRRGRGSKGQWNCEERGSRSVGVRSSHQSYSNAHGGVFHNVHAKSGNNVLKNTKQTWKPKSSVDDSEKHENKPDSVTVDEFPAQMGDLLNQNPQISNTLQELTTPCTPSTPLVVEEFSSLAVDNSAHKVEEYHESASEKTAEGENSNHVEVFDICPPKKGNHIVLKPSLYSKNRVRRNESKQGQGRSILRSGMVHLKNYIPFLDQVKIVKTCRALGIGSGGFYQPGYRDGAKLHLKMMCLGMNWDPQSGIYGDKRKEDGATPPAIPTEFYNLVERALHDSHVLIQEETKECNPEMILPVMKPDICIVNFYTSSGRLGLHQDKDESGESLRKGLPVVSFSFGDSGEFLYGPERDVEEAEEVILQSGDVLIFGGKSRHVFHGVSKVIPGSAPMSLNEETNMRPGRLNLTFRQYRP